MYKEQLKRGTRKWHDPSSGELGEWYLLAMTLDDWHAETYSTHQHMAADAIAVKPLMNIIPTEDSAATVLPLDFDPGTFAVRAYGMIRENIEECHDEDPGVAVANLALLGCEMLDFPSRAYRHGRVKEVYAEMLTTELIRIAPLFTPPIVSLLDDPISIETSISPFWVAVKRHFGLEENEVMRIEKNAERASADGPTLPLISEMQSWLDLRNNRAPSVTSTSSSDVGALYASLSKESLRGREGLDLLFAMRWWMLGEDWPEVSAEGPMMEILTEVHDGVKTIVADETLPDRMENPCTARLPILGAGGSQFSGVWTIQKDWTPGKLQELLGGRLGSRDSPAYSYLRRCLIISSGLDMRVLLKGLISSALLMTLRRALAVTSHLLPGFLIKKMARMMSWLRLTAFAGIVVATMLSLRRTPVSRHLNVTFSHSPEGFAGCTEHDGEVRTVGAERVPCRRCGILLEARVEDVTEYCWETVVTSRTGLVSAEVFNELIGPERTPSTFKLENLHSFLTERVVAGRVAAAFGLLRNNAVSALDMTQDLAKAWWTDKFANASDWVPTASQRD